MLKTLTTKLTEPEVSSCCKKPQTRELEQGDEKTVMEKPSWSKREGLSKSSSRVKVLGTGRLQLGGDAVASTIIGGIVEKGISDEPSAVAFTPPPKPSALPFPVARHRSHGPHWHPIGKKRGDVDNNRGEVKEEDNDGLNGLADFANPVQRKEKKSMDFKRWKEELLSANASKDSNVGRSTDKTKEKRHGGEALKTVDKINSSVEPLSADDASGTGSSQKDVARAQAENMQMHHTLPEVQKRQELKPSTSSTVSGHGSNNSINEQGSMSLESQIDAENRSRLLGMSSTDIADAQAEIMEKMDPALVMLLKKRGQGKLKKQEGLSSNLAANGEPVSLKTGNQLNQDAKGSPHFDSDTHHKMTETASKDTENGIDNVCVQKPSTVTKSLWSVWSERVESVRWLRFSLDGAVIRPDTAQESDTGGISDCSSVAERDYLRTEGDPGAAGYTIKEAVALSRSVIPGQRSLAFHLLSSVLIKALHNCLQNQVGSTLKGADSFDSSIDWEAIWAYALGPEPELILSLRMSLDDNHGSVVLACAKVIQCALSCDLNENFFDISEKIATRDKDLYTAPVFRSKPEIDVGFLHGGFWKYSAKPSNILPFGEDIMDDDDETDEKHTIQDDIVVAGQDFAAALIRMGILPRILYILETDPTAALEECLLSILVALARHSPTSATAVVKCPRLVQTVVQRFTMKGEMEIHPCKIKSVSLLRVLAQSNKKNCIDFIKNGIFRGVTWHLYRHVFSLKDWVQSGKEQCKLSAALMVEQLRFWKVCIQYGCCVSYFSDFYPALGLWLNPPCFEMLIENNVLNEFASISREAYLVLEALARSLPTFYSQRHTINQIPEYAGDSIEPWSWSYVNPMIDVALKWVALKGNPCICKLFGWQKGKTSDYALQESSMAPLLWVISAVLHMLSRVLERVTPKDTDNPDGRSRHVPWLPEFIPKIGLEIIKNGFLSFSGANAIDPAGDSSFVEELCCLRQKNEYETSLASVSCLYGLVRIIASIDALIQLAKAEVRSLPSEGYTSTRDGKILEDGICELSLSELRSAHSTFTRLGSSEWCSVQSVEMFGRGGPAPGAGFGWGASGGGFWSTTVLLAQTDAELLVHLLEMFPVASSTHLPPNEDMNVSMEMVHSALTACLTVGPRDRAILEKALNVLLQVPVLKYLHCCTQRFLSCNKGIKQFGWVYTEEDYTLFSKVLTSHYRNRWLCVKKKGKSTEGNSSGNKTFKKGGVPLDTIHEDNTDLSNLPREDDSCTSLVVEWAHQRLPLPTHWFLSPIATINISNHVDPQKASKTQSLEPETTDSIEVAESGLFFLLGIESMSSLLNIDAPSPIQNLPLIWKLHSLSVILLAGMGVLEKEKSRDVYEVLQDLYGLLLDDTRLRVSDQTLKKDNIEFLKFQSVIQESYSTFTETLVDQFSSVSYGNLIYGRQAAMYLHRCIEAPVRLSAWNALSNARVLELLPPLEKCIAEADGYLEPVEEDEGILEAYVKSWVSGALDKAATRNSVAYSVVLHHLSSFIFLFHANDKSLLRNKLSKSLLRDYARKPGHERMMLDLIQHDKLSWSATPESEESEEGLSLKKNNRDRKFEVLVKACDGSSSLLSEVEKLKRKLCK